jgi:hypothetical protein
MEGHHDYEHLAWVAEEFWARKNYKSALACYTIACLAFVKIYPDRSADTDLLGLKDGAARCFEHLSDLSDPTDVSKFSNLKECIMLDFEVLKEKEKILDSNDEELLILRETLAENNAQIGNHEAALSLLRTNLKILECKEYGLEDEWTLQTRYRVGVELSLLGENQQALILLEKTLSVMTTNGFPQEQQEIVREAIHGAQEFIEKTVANEARNNAIPSNQYSRTADLKPCTPPEHQKLILGTFQSTSATSNETAVARSKENSQRLGNNEPQSIPLGLGPFRCNTLGALFNILWTVGVVSLVGKPQTLADEIKSSTDGTRSRASSCSPSIRPFIQLEKGAICHNEDGNGQYASLFVPYTIRLKLTLQIGMHPLRSG